MIVGYMRNPKKPGKMATEIAKVCSENGIDLIYFTAKGVNRKTGKVKGQVLLNDGWTTTIVELPSIIDISPLCIKHRKQVKYLQNHCILTDNMENFLTKENISELTADNEMLEPVTIPTKKINTYVDILDYIRDYNKVKVQALFKKDYTGDYIIYYENREVYVFEDDEWTAYDLPGFEEWYNQTADNKAHIVQKFYESKTESNIPFHFRVNIDKDGNNVWDVTKIFTKLNDTDHDAEPITFLKEHYTDSIAENIVKQIHDLSVLFALQVEEYRKHNLMTLGIDFGVTSDGDLFIQEANNSPGTSKIQSEVALKRANYYNHLIEKHQLQ